MIEIGKTYGTEVKIQIDSIDKDKICATVVEVDNFWSSPNRISLLCIKRNGTEIWSINFEIGQKLEFGSHGGKIESPNHLPWFPLNIDKETFEHYR
jgi:hypothetical protein